MTIDKLNEQLRLGLASPEDAERFCQEWNASGNKFHEARYLGGKVVIFLLS